jgi:hypothetical protein
MNFGAMANQCPNGREMQAIELSLRPFGEYNFEIGAKLEIENGKIRKTNRSNTSR